MSAIYLAGKITKNDWRQTVLERPIADSNYGPETNRTWRATPTIYDGIDYAGPYFISCDHGCTHGPSTHGRLASPQGDTCGAEITEERRETTLQQCLDAITNADIFFAWLEPDHESPHRWTPDDHFTGYGTLVELGYAKALNKPIIVAASAQPAHSHDPWQGGTDVMDELWFAWTAADFRIVADTPVEALSKSRGILAQVHDETQRRLLESPLEVAFFDAYCQARPTALSGLTVQHPVTANGRNYRLDFALPQLKVAFEMDGKTYHGTDKAFTRDRRRDLNLELHGWTIHRFDGDLIRADPAAIVDMAAQLAARHNRNTA